MNWTNDKPTVPGWYWMRSAGKPPEVVQVEFYQHSGGRLALYRSGSDEDTELADYDKYVDALEWFGPLDPPK